MEDDPECRELVALFLEASGVDVATALTCAEAFEALGRQRFDVVLADLGLPDQDGFRVARWVREHAPGTRVVLLSGWGTAAGARGARDVDALLAKPVSPALLLDTLERLCAPEPPKPKEGRSP